MNIWYLLAAPGWFFVVITAATRLADMGKDEWKLRDHTRRLGLMGAGALGTVMLLTPFVTDGWLYDDSTWRGTLMAWSWALVWLTSPNMPPWWDTVLGVHRTTEEWKSYSWRRRLAVEWRALRSSFKPRRFKPPLAGPKGPLP